MKNLNMTINSNAITTLGPPAYPAPPLNPEHSVSFSARFDNEDEAIAFVKAMIAHIQDFKDNK